MIVVSFLLALVAILLTVVDWLQTIHIARNPSRFYEKNPILGRHPSVRRVCIYFAGCLCIAVVLTATLLAVGWYEALVVLALALAALEGYWVVNNHRLGIKLG